MTAKGSAALKLEGKISGPWVDELESCWKEVAAETNKKLVTVDMRSVTFADARGGKLLRSMEQHGAHLVECSNFVRQLVNVADADGPVRRKNGRKLKKEN